MEVEATLSFVSSTVRRAGEEEGENVVPEEMDELNEDLKSREEEEEEGGPEEGEGMEEEEEDNDNAAGNNDETIRTYIRKQIKKFGGISTENVRKTFAIGWIRAKRLHDQEMGLKTDEVRYASDDKLRRYIRHCFDEKGSCSVNHLRQEFSVGYNRAKKILDEERERAEG
jgi:DNA segregation ATPase FtsK/SpoIIIE-like protein